MTALAKMAGARPIRAVIAFERVTGPVSLWAGLGGILGQAEAWLLAIAAHGDREAFSALAAAYGPALRARIASSLRDDAKADEVAQEVLLTIWRKASSYDPDKAAASTWMYAIARNRMIDTVRKRNRAEAIPDDPAFVPDSPTAPDESVRQAQLSQRVQAALQELPVEQREVVVRAAFDAQTFQEIAEACDIPVGTAKSRARLAFQRLRILLGTEEG